MFSAWRLVSVTLMLAFLTTSPLGENAMAADDKKPQNNTMGNITNNTGIVTQGQVGNNTIINPLVRDQNGLYQSGYKVGRVENPIIDLSKGFVSFQVMHFSEYPDPTKPLEYREHFIHCADIPLKEPNTFVGQLSAMVVGAQCKIIR